jgi:chromosome partitioning protein
LKAVVEQLHTRRIELLPVVLMEKEAFRALFSIGGGFSEVQREGVSGVSAARSNADALLRCVLDIVTPGQPERANEPSQNKPVRRDSYD